MEHHHRRKQLGLETLGEAGANGAISLSRGEETRALIGGAGRWRGDKRDKCRSEAEALVADCTVWLKAQGGPKVRDLGTAGWGREHWM